jgi:RNA polymerase sigma-70 factor (ECF subfamily)
VTKPRRRDRSQFATTRWSIVLAAGGEGASREALATLCENYWYPLYAYLRRQGHSAEDAQDLAATLNLSEGAVKVAVHRLRRRFRALLNDEISHTVAAPEDVEDELHYLFRALQS